MKHGIFLPSGAAPLRQVCRNRNPPRVVFNLAAAANTKSVVNKEKILLFLLLLLLRDRQTGRQILISSSSVGSHQSVSCHCSLVYSLWGQPEVSLRHLQLAGARLRHWTVKDFHITTSSRGVFFRHPQDAAILRARVQ